MIISIGLFLSNMVVVGLLFILFLASKTLGAIVHLDEYCGNTIQLSTEGGFLLRSQQNSYYKNNFNCEVTLTALDANKRILLSFNRFDVEDLEGNSCYDKLHIYSGSDEIRLTDSQGLCGSSPYMPSDYVADKKVKLHFITDTSVVKQGFEIVMSEFYEVDDVEKCENDEYYCLDTNRCIGQDLDQNNYDYCGDESYIDESSVLSTSTLSTATVFGITIGVVAGIIFCGGLCYGMIAKWKENRPKRISPAERLQMQELQRQDMLRHQLRPVVEDPFWRHPTPPPAYGSERFGLINDDTNPAVGTVSAMVHYNEAPPSYEDATRSSESQNTGTTQRDNENHNRATTQGNENRNTITTRRSNEPSGSINNPLLPGQVAPNYPNPPPQVVNRQNSRIGRR